MHHRLGFHGYICKIDICGNNKQKIVYKKNKNKNVKK